MENMSKLQSDMYNDIRDEDFRNNRGVVNIYIGRTGEGKTHAVINTQIPELIKAGVKLIMYSVPEASIRQDDLFRDVALRNQAHFVTRFDEAIRLLSPKNGQPRHPVIMAVNNAYLVNKSGKAFLNWIVNNSDNFMSSLTVDEAHQWLVSLQKNYRDIRGSNTPDYNASLPDSLALLATVTPFVCGITATPTGEMTGEIISSPNLKFVIRNSASAKEDTAFKTAWIEDTKFYTQELTEYALQEFIYRIHKKSVRHKRTGFIQTCRDNPNKDNWGLKRTIDHVIKNLKNIHEEESWKNKMIVILTHHQKCIMDLHGNIEKVDEQTAIHYLRDAEHPAQFLIVIDKGRCGLNVPNFGGEISLRFNDKTDSKGRLIIDMYTQFIGRLVRVKTLELVDSNNDVSGFIRGVRQNEKLTHLEKTTILNELLEDNSFIAILPDTPGWRKAVANFEENYCNTLIEIRKLIDEI